MAALEPLQSVLAIGDSNRSHSRAQLDTPTRSAGGPRPQHVARSRWSGAFLSLSTSYAAADRDGPRSAPCSAGQRPGITTNPGSDTLSPCEERAGRESERGELKRLLSPAHSSLFEEERERKCGRALKANLLPNTTGRSRRSGFTNPPPNHRSGRRSRDCASHDRVCSQSDLRPTRSRDPALPGFGRSRFPP